MPDQMAKNNYSKTDMSLMNHNENLRENNVLLPDENKVMIILQFYSDVPYTTKTTVYINKLFEFVWLKKIAPLNYVFQSWVYTKKTELK